MLKNKKLFLIISFLIILCLILVFVFFKPFEEKEPIDPNNIERVERAGNIFQISRLEDGQEVSIAGKVFNLSESNFNVENENISILVYFENFEIISDFVLVEGEWNEEYQAIMAKDIVFLTEGEYAHYVKLHPEDFAKTDTSGRYRYMLGIDVLDFPSQVESSCEPLVFELEVTNLSESVISYSDIYSPDYEFGFYQIIDEVPSKQEGLSDFGVLDVDESAQVEFVVSGDYGSGERNFSFGWAKDYDSDRDLDIRPVFYFKTREEVIEVLDDC